MDEWEVHQFYPILFLDYFMINKILRVHHYIQIHVEVSPDIFVYHMPIEPYKTIFSGILSQAFNNPIEHIIHDSGGFGLTLIILGIWKHVLIAKLTIYGNPLNIFSKKIINGAELQEWFLRPWL